MAGKKIWSIVITVVILLAIVSGLVIGIKTGTTASKIDIKQAEALVNKVTDDMAVTKVLSTVAEKNYITVEEISYGSEKDIILKCSVKTVDVYSKVSPNYNEFLSSNVKKNNSSMYKSALDFKLEFEGKLMEMVQQADEKEEKCEITLYETKDGIKIYATDEVTDCVYGGVVKICDDVSKITEYTAVENGIEVKKTITVENVKKGFVQCLTLRRDTTKPDTSSFIIRTWNELKEDFSKNFIQHDRWKTILTGLWVTIKLTIFALLIGIVLGFLVAFIRCTYLKTAKQGVLLRFFNSVSGIYLTIIRGTPVVVQIMIIYFVIFMPMGVDKFTAAVICFGLNSGAYVAEIVRGGIMSIDNGQFEAGRSLGFGYMATMYNIIFPQAFKAVLPALANEFVVLLKETSIAFYIGLGDLMYAGNAIRAATYSAFMPLIAVAVIYFIMVLALSKLVSLLERRLRKSER